MNTLLLIVILILLFLIYCAVCIGIVFIVDCFGLELWNRAFPNNDKLWDKYWWYKFAIFAYIIAITSFIIIGAIILASKIF